MRQDDQFRRIEQVVHLITRTHTVVVVHAELHVARGIDERRTQAGERRQVIPQVHIHPGFERPVECEETRRRVEPVESGGKPQITRETRTRQVPLRLVQQCRDSRKDRSPVHNGFGIAGRVCGNRDHRAQIIACVDDQQQVQRLEGLRDAPEPALVAGVHRGKRVDGVQHIVGVPEAPVAARPVVAAEGAVTTVQRVAQQLGDEAGIRRVEVVGLASDNADFRHIPGSSRNTLSRADEEPLCRRDHGNPRSTFTGQLLDARIVQVRDHEGLAGAHGHYRQEHRNRFVSVHGWYPFQYGHG